MLYTGESCSETGKKFGRRKRKILLWTGTVFGNTDLYEFLIDTMTLLVINNEDVKKKLKFTTVSL